VSTATGAEAAAGISLEVSALRIAFAERGDALRTILDVPSLAAPGRAQVALCGPSGSGKTTLLDVLAGLQRPQRGRVHWSAIELTALDERALTRWRRASVEIGRASCRERV
jgi:putative ABC transport system ATP-binding protein